MGELDELLGDGAGPLHEGPGLEIAPGGPQDADHVHPRMVVEPGVLGGDESVLHVVGQVADANEQPLLAAAQGGKEPVLSVKDLDRKLLIGQLLLVQHVPGVPAEHVGGQKGHRRQQQNRKEKKPPPQRAAACNAAHNRLIQACSSNRTAL